MAKRQARGGAIKQVKRAFGDLPDAAFTGQLITLADTPVVGRKKPIRRSKKRPLTKRKSR